MPALRTTATAFAAAAAAALAAQSPLSGGPLAGSPVAIGVDGGSSLGPDATTLFHRSGFTGAPVPFPAGPGSPNLQAILAGFGAPNVDVDDFSTGRDDVLVAVNGRIDVPAMAWGMFTFSFRNGAVGTPGSRLAAEAAAGAVGGAVFSWILPGSSVPAPLIGAVARSHSRRELGLSTAGSPEVDVLDTPIVLGYDQATLNAIEPGFGAFFPTPQAIYFTVSTASVPLVPAAWWNVTGGPPAPSGATILRVVKSSHQGQWSSPQVFRAYWQLGLSTGEDIDGLAYDEASQKLVFSCVGNQRDQLLFLDLSTDFVLPVPVTKQDGTPVSQAVGTGQNDDIDAVCTLDPQLRTQGGWVPDDFGASCGTPRDPFLPANWPVGMSASAFRRYAGGSRFYDTWMLGWPPVAGVGPGFAVLLITLGDTTAPAVTASWQARVPTSSVPGDPRGYSLAVPASYALTGFPLQFRWWAIDGGLTEIAQAYPIKVFL